jgi:hypothetical protein
MTDAITSPEPSTAALDAPPLAQTLDEPTLRRVFAAAPADTSVARDVRSMFRARMRRVRGNTALVTGGAVAVRAGIALGLTSGVAGWVLLAIAIVAAVGTTIHQYSEASNDFFRSYAVARGLAHAKDGFISASVPLFRKGDERRWPLLMAGTIAGQRATLGHYTYTVVTHDSDGNRETTDHDFTVLHFTLPPAVAARFCGVYCSSRKLSLGALQDKLASDHKVELESAEFAKRYTLRAADGQDEVALYELFSPPFIELLATNLHAYWEQCGGDLVCWKQGHETEAADLDRFCLDSWYVLQRYLEEWQ